MFKLEINIRNEKITLLPEKAVFWESQKILFISDTHLGKAATFRSLNIPIPHGTTNHDLELLSSLINLYEIKQLIVLGDLLHAYKGRTEKIFQEFLGWRNKYKDLDIKLVRGNHDIKAGDPPKEWAIECLSEPYFISPFYCAHDLPSMDNNFILQGHIHPKCFVGERRRGGKLFPCFILEKNRLILPSFGSFTGGHPIPYKNSITLYPIIEGEIFQIGNTIKD